MSADLHKAKARYHEAGATACRHAVDAVRRQSGVDFHMREWSRSSELAFDEQWLPVSRHEDGGFDWPKIYSRYREPGTLKPVIWSPGERLSGLFLCTIHGKSVKLQWLEGDPRENCPLKGFRATIAVETMAVYAQLLGRPEICLEGVADGVKPLYIDGYGFTEVIPHKGSSYLKRAV